MINEDELNELKALNLYNIIKNESKGMDAGNLASVLITILGRMPIVAKKEEREATIILQACAIIAEGLNLENADAHTEKCIKTADELIPYIKEALQKYKATKAIKMNS